MYQEAEERNCACMCVGEQNECRRKKSALNLLSALAQMSLHHQILVQNPTSRLISCWKTNLQEAFKNELPLVETM